MRRLKEDTGASLVEYCLLVAMIALVCLGAITYFGGESGNSINNSKDKIVSAVG
jgi:Flp pilus assembly pilin Flp